MRITIGKKYVDVDCRFVFRNDGPARTVRMGFPEKLDGAYWTREGERRQDGEPPKPSLRPFRSFVNGRPVRTRLLRGKDDRYLWHAKDVRFPARGTVTVRNVYRQDVGIQVIGVDGDFALYVAQGGYVLHTGGSWRRPIGRAEVTVDFRRRSMGKLRPLPIREIRSEDGRTENWERPWTGDPGRVYYSGPSRPAVRGSRLVFVRRNWRPTRRDNIRLVFSCTRE